MQMFSMRFRVALGLVSILMMIMVLGSLLGLMPNQPHHQMWIGRRDVGEKRLLTTAFESYCQATFPTTSSKFFL